MEHKLLSVYKTNHTNFLLKSVILLLVFKGLYYLTMIEKCIQSLIMGNRKYFLSDHKRHHFLYHKRMKQILLLKSIIYNVKTSELLINSNFGRRAPQTHHFYAWQSRVLECTRVSPGLWFVLVLLDSCTSLFKGL